MRGTYILWLLGLRPLDLSMAGVWSVFFFSSEKNVILS